MIKGTIREKPVDVLLEYEGGVLTIKVVDADDYVVAAEKIFSTEKISRLIQDSKTMVNGGFLMIGKFDMNNLVSLDKTETENFASHLEDLINE